LGVRAGILLLGRTCAFACMHPCTRTRIHTAGTQWAMHLLYCTAWHSGQAGAWGCALVRACLHTTAGRTLSLTHACALTQLLKGDSPKESHWGRQFTSLDMCVTSRARASPIFSVARNAHPNLSARTSHVCDNLKPAGGCAGAGLRAGTLEHRGGPLSHIGRCVHARAALQEAQPGQHHRQRRALQRPAQAGAAGTVLVV